MTNPFDTYYDILPYQSFHDLQLNEEYPGDDVEIPDELIDAITAGDLEDLDHLYRDFPMR